MWDELGIAPCGDPKAIRRAYAARLKTLDPDRDPAAFARLRQALEWALAQAEEGYRVAADSSAPDGEALDPADDIDVAATLPDRVRRSADVARPETLAEVEPAEDWRALAPRERALMQALESALDRCDAAQAATLYLRAAAGGLVPLRGAPALLERLFAVALREPMLEPAAFRELARACGWDKPESGEVSDVRRRVLARLAAEDWYETLVAAASRRKRGPRRQVRAARLFLGRIGRFWRPRIDRAALKVHLDNYRIHGPWLHDRIDPAWVRRLGIWWRRREILLLAILALCLAAFLADGVGVFVTAALNGTLQPWGYAFAPVFTGFLLWMLKRITTALYRLIRMPRTDAGTGPPSDPEARLVWLERQAELAYEAMYGAPAGSPFAARFSDAKEFLHEAIALARGLGHVGTAERLSRRLAEIKEIARAQVPAE